MSVSYNNQGYSSRSDVSRNETGAVDSIVSTTFADGSTLVESSSSDSPNYEYF